MGLFKELKRRNVFRVGLAYMVSAWIIAQVASLVLDSIGTPPWVMQTLLLALGLGFIVALIIAWAYELTPEGIKKEKDVVRDDTITNITAKKLDYITLFAALGVLALFIYQQTNPAKTVVNTKEAAITKQIDSKSQDDEKDKAKKQNTVTDASIAVLPFADLSPDKNQGYFSDGIAEEILNVLVRIDSLKVASRTSAFGFKGQESLGLPMIAKRLKVRHILEGSVRKSGDMVRITAQLIDAQTDAHLWSNTFDRQLTTENIFAVQDEIAAAIVKQLGLVIADENTNKPMVKKATENLDAYELYLKAQALYHIRSADNLPQIIKLYKKAVSIDPNFAKAWAGLGAAYLVMPGWGLGTSKDYYPKAQTAANRATELDDNLALPYAIRGAVVTDQGNYIDAMNQMDVALKLDPKNIQTIHFQSFIILSLGYLKQAEIGYRHCLELDSSFGICHRMLPVVLLFQGRIEESTEMFEDGMLKKQFSYRDAFVDYYAATGDKRALKLLLATYNKTPIWFRELTYRYQTDNTFSLTAFNAEVKAKFVQTTSNPDPLIPERTLKSLTDNFPENFLWNPYLAELRRPELRDDYLQFRKQFLKDKGMVKYWRKNGFPPQCHALGDDDFDCDIPSVKKP